MYGKEPNKILAVKLPVSMHNAVKQTAARRGITASELVRRHIGAAMPTVNIVTPKHGRHPGVRQ
jgi:hypothetical protein